MPVRGVLRVILASVALFSSLGCDLLSPLDGDAADLRGTWQYTSKQANSPIQLAGQIIIDQQNGQLISGTASWEEADGLGGVRLDGGPISGRAIGFTDADFDVILESGDRRHVATISADTLSGVWIDVDAALNGSFRAVRGPQ